jgi:predicted MFS family arabinose efflux permease
MPPADGSSALLHPPSQAESGRPGAAPLRFFSKNRFLLTFAALSSLMGTTVGMAQVSASLYAVELGSSEAMLGLIAGAQSIGVLLISLPIGMLVDRLGPAKPFVLGTLLAGMTYAVVPVSASPAWLLVCTAAISFFMPLRFVSLNTVFLQQLASLGEAKAGWYRGTHMLGMFLIGPSLGARAISSLGFTWTYRVISAAFLLTVVVSPIVFSRYARAPERPRAGGGWRALREQLRVVFDDAELRTVSLIESATQAVGAFFTFFIVVLAVSSAHLSAAQASTFVAAKGGTFILALFALGGLIQRLGQGRAFSLGFAAITIALTILGCADGQPLLWLGSLALGLGLGLVQIATLTRYAKLGGRAGYGKVSGLSALVGPSGGVLGSLLGGLLGKWVGLQTTFLIAAAGFGLGWWLLRRGQPERRRRAG